MIEVLFILYLSGLNHNMPTGAMGIRNWESAARACSKPQALSGDHFGDLAPRGIYEDRDFMRARALSVTLLCS